MKLTKSQYKLLQYSEINLSEVNDSEQLMELLRNKFNIDIIVGVYGEIDYYMDNPPLEKTYVGKVYNWNVKWSVHDGTGAVLPENYKFPSKDYNTALSRAIDKAIEIITK